MPAEVRDDGPSLYDIASEDGGIPSAGPGNYTVGVMIDFFVNRTILTPLATQSNSEDLVLYGSFIGSDFSTQIKGGVFLWSMLCTYTVQMYDSMLSWSVTTSCFVILYT